MRGIPLLIVTATAAILTTAACSDTCTDNKNALPRAGFYITEGGRPVQVSVDSLEVTGAGAPSDSVLLNPSAPGVSELYLPFRIDSDTTKYVFTDAHKKSQLRDTVTFIYSRTPRLVSVECGVSYIFDVRSISSQNVLIDSVACPEGFIDNKPGENLQIYFKTAAEP